MPKNKSAQALARLRAKSLTPERRSEIARKAANTRWNKRKLIREYLGRKG